MSNDVPAEIEARLSTILGARPRSWSKVEGGYTPTARWRVDCGSYSVFVKVATTPLTATLLRREQVVYGSVSGTFIPNLVGWDEHETEPMLVIEDLSRAHWPPPWTPSRVEQALVGIAAMHRTRAVVPPFDALHRHHTQNWRAVAEDPLPFLGLQVVDESWLDKYLSVLIEAEAACQTSGNTLTHFDLRSDNLCFTDAGAILVDWAEACLSSPKLDLGSWLPSLAFEGGPQPEDVLPNEPEVAAWVSGFFAARAGLPPIPDAPQVRRAQREQLSTALPWVQRALALH